MKLSILFCSVDKKGKCNLIQKKKKGSYLHVTCGGYLTSCCFIYRMPVVKSRHIIFQESGPYISEAFAEHNVSIIQI